MNILALLLPFRLTLCAILLWVPMVVLASPIDIRGEWDAVGTCHKHCMFFVMDHVDKRAPEDIYFIFPASETQPILGWPLTYVGGKQKDEWRIEFVGKKGTLYLVNDKLITPGGMTYKKRFDIDHLPDNIFSLI